MLPVAKVTRFELDKHSLTAAAVLLLYGILSGTEQTPEGEKEVGERQREGINQPWHWKANDGCVGRRAACVFAAGFLFPTCVAAPWPRAPLGSSCLPVMSGDGVQS